MAQDKQATVPVEEYVRTFSPEVRQVVEQLRDLIRAAHPGAVERAYPGWGSIRYLTSARFADRVVYLSSGRGYVNLGLQYSRTLPDPRGLLAGEGANMRHVRVVVGGPFEEPYYRDLLKAAFTPFLARRESEATADKPKAAGKPRSSKRRKGRAQPGAAPDRRGM